jgi:hypothetical protein
MGGSDGDNHSYDPQLGLRSTPFSTIKYRVYPIYFFLTPFDNEVFA